MEDINYVWSIYNLTVVPEMTMDDSQPPLANVVTQIWWVLKASLNGHTVHNSGIVEVPPPSVPFHEFETLTQEEVIGWLMLILAPNVDRLKDELRGRLEDIINPPIVHRLPTAWLAPPSTNTVE